MKQLASPLCGRGRRCQWHRRVRGAYLSLPRKRESRRKEEKSVLLKLPLTREQARIPAYAGITHRPLHSAKMLLFYSSLVFGQPRDTKRAKKTSLNQAVSCLHNLRSSIGGILATLRRGSGLGGKHTKGSTLPGLPNSSMGSCSGGNPACQVPRSLSAPLRCGHDTQLTLRGLTGRRSSDTILADGGSGGIGRNKPLFLRSISRKKPFCLRPTARPALARPVPESLHPHRPSCRPQ